MRRICFFVLHPSMAQLSAALRDWLEARDGTYAISDEAGCKHVLMTYEDDRLELWARHLRDVGPNQAWQVLPHADDWSLATRFYRFLARQGVTVLSPGQVLSTYGSTALDGYRWICAGDDVDTIYTTNYEPSQADIDSDTEITESELFA